ncbi:MAG TPA: heme peroxidase family protein [Amycolatopsis sp.]|nr:heme peroxidase family protein [Amycolatopsis sp.]
MSTRHGLEVRGMNVPRGIDPPAGRFGRMFPTVPPRAPAGLPMAERFGLPGGVMDGGSTTKKQDSPTLDAGFTFFGQFIDHNITFDATGNLGRQVDPEATQNFRPPLLDLDHLYGAGPFANPLLYDNRKEAPHNLKLAVSEDGYDLARTADGVARIGDPRNDENLLLNQTHLAFIKFHNKVVDSLVAGTITDVFGNQVPPPPGDLPPNPPPNATIDELLGVRGYYDDLFAKAQQIVRWHYQWIIVHEYLPLVCGRETVDRILKHGRRFFLPASTPFIPVEFAVAAFRFMHPTIRSDYTINDRHTLPLFPTEFTDPLPPPDQRTDLRGGPVTKEFAVDFTKFFAVNGHAPQRAKRIEAKLNTRLLDLPPITDVPVEVGRQLRSLVVRNLLRSEVQQLLSGQDIARKIGESPLTESELGTEGPAYLWFYLLKEAELKHKGGRLGAVGGTIVAEVLLGLLDADPTSYRSAYPIWTPTLADSENRFGIADLLRFAGVAA